MSVTPSVPSPAPVGTKVTFTATVSGSADKFWYRFRVRDQAGEYRTVRDYGPVPSLLWTAAQHDGSYDIEVSVRDLSSGDSAITSTSFQFTPRATSSNPVVSPTSHPLVFLYSAPGCQPGQRMLVEFAGPDGVTQHTPLQECDGRSMNFYLAGLRADTTYSARHSIQNRGEPTGTSAPVTFTTGSIPPGLYAAKIVIASQGASEGVLLGSPLASPAVAHDIAGNVIWFGPSDLSYITRVDRGGYVWGLVGIIGGATEQQLVRKIDITGMTVLETNAARVSEQLFAQGKRPITGFHHEATPLPDGRVAVLGGVEQIVEDIQGPGLVDVVGDMIVVLDQNLNVVWSWDTFDHLDIRRTAVLGEMCPQSSCPPMLLAQTGTDWTHGNSVQATPDGDLIYSARHQDWLIRIAYENSFGDGRIVWRLGKDGNFTAKSSDPYPWFSHQHDANFEVPAMTNRSAAYRSTKALPRLMVFDNGNTRVAAQGGNGHSRGQVWEIDEVNRTATLVLNADLGVYSLALGAAERLDSGNYHFDVGYVTEGGAFGARGLEVTPEGTIIYDATANTVLYRSFRMPDMYTPSTESRRGP